MMKGGIGEGRHGKMQDWFPKLKALHFFVSVFAPIGYASSVPQDDDDSDSEMMEVEEETKRYFEEVSPS